MNKYEAQRFLNKLYQAELLFPAPAVSTHYNRSSGKNYPLRSLKLLDADQSTIRLVAITAASDFINNPGSKISKDG